MLICDKLYKRYAKNAPYAVEDLTLKVGEGEIFDFSVPTAESTTILKMIVSLLNRQRRGESGRHHRKG